MSTQAGRKIALYFTGRQHAGENLRDVLQHRVKDLATPIQMCDALSRNAPKLSDGAEILLANCLAHYPDTGVIQSRFSECAHTRVRCVPCDPVLQITL